MYSYSSSTPLLCREDSVTEGDSPAWRGDEQDEDWSSGYDSTDVSDTESDVMSTASVPDVHERLSTSGDDDGVQEVMKFKSTHALSESLKLMLEMPEMCDVTFLVGSREVPVYGVRAIMGTRSRVLYQLILRHLRMDNGVTGELTKTSKKTKKCSRKNSQNPRFTPGHVMIPVRKYDSEVFRMLVQFVHCGCAAITDETVTGLIGPGIFIILTGYAASNTAVAVTLLTIGISLSGCQYDSGFIVNPVDIAPRYAGIIFGISNTTGTLGGVLAPIVIGIITTDRTREQWLAVFFIAAAIYTFGALFYIVFGSGDIQSWATEGLMMDTEINVIAAGNDITSCDTMQIDREKSQKQSTQM